MRHVICLDTTSAKAIAATKAIIIGISMFPMNAINVSRFSLRRKIEPFSSFVATYKVSLPKVFDMRVLTALPDFSAACTSGRFKWLSSFFASVALSNKTTPSP